MKPFRCCWSSTSPPERPFPHSSTTNRLTRKMAVGRNEALDNIALATNKLNFDLYKGLAAEPGNFFFSPVSIQTILTLVYLGAGGNTAKQLSDSLLLPEDKEFVEDGVAAMMNSLQDSNDVLLDIANGIFLKEGFSTKERFNQSAARCKAAVEEVDFLKEEQARKTINDWVEGKTNSKIKDIIPPRTFNRLTRMVLVNAIYFKGNWLKQFEKEHTAPKPFHSASGGEKDVDMMYLVEKFEYTNAAYLRSQVLLLPYKGERLTMMIFLPRERNGFAYLEKKLGNLILQDTLNDMKETEVHVYLPKFKLEYSKQLNAVLTGLGITDAFDDTASNFTGISDERLKVDKVLHKAFVEVNEEGTEAAAATALTVAATSLGSRKPRPIIFRADHPFAFLILDRKTSTVLFMGRYCDPPSTSRLKSAAS